jgi:hypothetical protein
MRNPLDERRAKGKAVSNVSVPNSSTHRRRCPYCCRINWCQVENRTPLCPQEHPCWFCGKRFNMSKVVKSIEWFPVRAPRGR